jgi:hypothetical protein
MVPVDGQMQPENGRTPDHRMDQRTEREISNSDIESETPVPSERDEASTRPGIDRPGMEANRSGLEATNRHGLEKSNQHANEPTTRPALETPHLAEQASSQAGDRWRRIQADFVDDPRKAVGDAHKLVGELLQRIVEGFSRERDSLEKQWTRGGDVSTEDLRVCLQHYRAFFTRLLPSAGSK